MATSNAAQIYTPLTDAARFLAGALAASPWRRGACDPCHQHRGLARASPGEDRSLGRRAVAARLSRLAARRARPLHDGGGSQPGGRGEVAPFSWTVQGV